MNSSYVFLQRTFRFPRPLAEVADASPLFGSVWVGDSVIAKPRPEAVVLLSAFAARTSRVRPRPPPARRDRCRRLQYQPLVRAETHYAVPMNVFGDSNVIRNAFQLARVRIHHQDDPSEAVLANAFQGRGLPTRHGVRYHHNEQDGEIDVLAVVDGIAFAFECKNSLLPANPFELRQTLIYLERANEQLDRLRVFWQEPAFVQALQQKTELELVPGMPLVTCAVTANRMLSGSLFGSHPVRGLFELGSFLHLGGVEILGQSVRVIEGTDVSGEDLRAYIEGDSLHARMLSAMVPHEPAYSVGGVKVVRRTFALNLLLVAKEFDLEIPEDFRGALSEEQAGPAQD